MDCPCGASFFVHPTLEIIVHCASCKGLVCYECAVGDLPEGFLCPPCNGHREKELAAITDAMARMD